MPQADPAQCPKKVPPPTLTAIVAPNPTNPAISGGIFGVEAIFGGRGAYSLAASMTDIP